MIRTIVHFIDSFQFGGMEQCILNLLAGFDRRHWRPVLMYHPEPGIERLLEEALQLGVSLHPIPRVYASQSVMNLPAMFQALRTEKPTIFHAHQGWQFACGYGLLTASIAGIPVVVATSHLFNDEIHNKVNLVKSKLITASVDLYIAVSHWVAGKLCNTLGVKERKVSVVRNGIDVDFYNRPPAPLLRSELVVESNRPVILTPARLVEQKGHRYLFEAAVLVPEAIFLLVGDGPNRTTLEALAKSLGLNERIRFLGHRQDIPALLSICDLFVLPSLFEGLPLTILEAMAAGKPVISSAIGGTEEAIVHGESGILVPPRDASALAVAIRRILKDHTLARNIAAAGQERVRQYFSVNRMVKETVEIYEKLLASSG